MSKYSISPMQISKMNETELKNYLRSVWKVVQKRVKRISESEFSDFSELLAQYETLSNRYGGKFTGSSKGLKLKDLRRKAKDMLTLVNITETKKQLENEGYRNIKNFFKEPRFTKAFIESINKNKKILASIANKNDAFIHEILPSKEIYKIFDNDKSEEEQYKDLLVAVSEELDLRDNAEKEQLINEKFDPIFEHISGTKWREIESGEIVDVNEKWEQ